MKQEALHHRPPLDTGSSAREHPRERDPSSPERDPDLRRLPSMRLLGATRLRMHHLMPDEVRSFHIPYHFVTVVRETLRRVIHIERGPTWTRIQERMVRVRERITHLVPMLQSSYEREESEEREDTPDEPMATGNVQERAPQRITQVPKARISLLPKQPPQEPEPKRIGFEDPSKVTKPASSAESMRTPPARQLTYVPGAA